MIRDYDRIKKNCPGRAGWFSSEIYICAGPTQCWSVSVIRVYFDKLVYTADGWGLLRLDDWCQLGKQFHDGQTKPGKLPPVWSGGMLWTCGNFFLWPFNNLIRWEPREEKMSFALVFILSFPSSHKDRSRAPEHRKQECTGRLADWYTALVEWYLIGHGSLGFIRGFRARVLLPSTSQLNGSLKSKITGLR